MASAYKELRQLCTKVIDFLLEERITIYTRFGKMDSTNVKIFSVVDESFEKK
jgi:hypothetical protein